MWRKIEVSRFAPLPVVSPADGPEGPMQRCLEARRPVYHAIATAVSLGRRLSDSPRVLAQMYKYVRQLDTMPYCRLSSSSSSAYPLEGTATATPAHMHLIHTIQSTSPEDPWLQAEWGRTLNAVGRTQVRASYCLIYVYEIMAIGSIH
ncbi:hypothetical protein Vretimale_1489 [Volvox reticuliferus]|uniref:Uncharacterized protein n=1 Tax=Volvox reticuliferus TaxID=1737510 RepID=A0A8J4FYA2_9CHLO|nr:hypothetical protein Vretimale_1489 [Volvox reticuliferus]